MPIFAPHPTSFTLHVISGVPLPTVKPTLRRLAASLAPQQRAGDFAQGLMDLGASICTPKRPSCLMCPLQGRCAAHAEGLAAALPIKATKADRPLRVGLAFVALREDGTVLLRRRPDAGLLGGMLEVPSTDWSETFPPLEQALRAAPVHGQWWAVPGTVATGRSSSRRSCPPGPSGGSRTGSSRRSTG